MPLSEERVNAIAMQVLQAHLEKGGNLKLIPSEIKRECHNMAKKMGIPVTEAADFIKAMLEKAYLNTMKELNAIIEPPIRGVVID
ncbi:hypothetical protein KKA39_01395 [Patescibacteria group bacterium]|nr:hypothetical protein [Patescibacteria group bacterium]MBU1727947.1 hypothetical protein [Patescibacteria group bacterium]